MSKKCSHPCCGDECRRPTKTKKVYRRKIKKFYRIPKVSKKREVINKNEYFPKVEAYLKIHTLCNIKIPEVCTVIATCVNHTKGRESIAQLLNEEDWEPSCYSCNTHIENHHAIAEAGGHKKKRHGIYQRRK